MWSKAIREKDGTETEELNRDQLQMNISLTFAWGGIFNFLLSCFACFSDLF